MVQVNLRSKKARNIRQVQESSKRPTRSRMLSPQGGVSWPCVIHPNTITQRMQTRVQYFPTGKLFLRSFSIFPYRIPHQQCRGIGMHCILPHTMMDIHGCYAMYATLELPVVTTVEQWFCFQPSDAPRGEGLKLPELQALSSSTGDEAECKTLHQQTFKMKGISWQ